jgi:hypothetical protein
MPGVTEQEIWITLVDVADHCIKVRIREFINVRDCAKNVTLEAHCLYLFLVTFR